MSEVKRVGQVGSLEKSLLQVLKSLVGDAALVHVDHLQVVAEWVLSLDQVSDGRSSPVSNLQVSFEGDRH